MSIGFGDADLRSGATYMLLYIVKVLLVLIPLAVIGYMALTAMGVDLGGSGGSGGGSTSGFAIRVAVPAVLVLVFAFMAGCYRSGSDTRLLFRVLLNIAMVIAILMIGMGVDYAVDQMLVSERYSITSQDLLLSVNPLWLMSPLLLIPVFSVVDAVLERGGAAGLREVIGRS